MRYGTSEGHVPARRRLSGSPSAIRLLNILALSLGPSPTRGEGRPFSTPPPPAGLQPDLQTEFPLTPAFGSSFVLRSSLLRRDVSGHVTASGIFDSVLSPRGEEKPLPSPPSPAGAHVGSTGGTGGSGASGASGGLFYFFLTFPPNSYQAKNYIRLNLCSEYASQAHHKSSWSSDRMAEHPLGVFALVNPMAERSLRVLTYRLDLGDLGDMGDVRMGIFHFFHRQKMYSE